MTEARISRRATGFLLYMFQASLAYTGIGALIGVAVILTGLAMLFVARYWQRHGPKHHTSLKGDDDSQPNHLAR